MGKNDHDGFHDPYGDMERKNNYSGLSEDFLEGVENNPYQGYSNVYQQRNADTGTTYRMKNAETVGRKSSGALKWVTLGFVLMAVAVIGVSVLGYSICKKLAYQAAVNVAYESVPMEDVIVYNQYTVVRFGEAYSLSGHEKLADFQEGYQLLMLPAKIISMEHVKDAYPFKQVYIGYEEKGETIYKTNVSPDENLKIYTRAVGIKDNRLLSSYAGNGFDSAGFLFFCIPEGVEKITLYIEMRETEFFIPVVKEVLYKEFAVNPYNKATIEALIEEGGRDL